MILTQSTTPIIGQIAILLGYIMQGIFSVLSKFGIENLGLCIIIFTFIVRMFMLPLTISQQKSQKINMAMQPELNKIQKKYKNKKDQASMQKQQKEMQEIYDKYGFSPTGGCLQLVVQMPIFFALYQVIRKIPAYIPQVYAQYDKIYDAISGQNGYIDIVNKIAGELGLQKGYVSELASKATENQVVDVLSYFRQESWDALAKAIPQAADVINTVSAKIVSMNDFMLGINVSQTPGLKISIYLLIPLAAGLFQYLSFKTMQQPTGDDNPAAGMTKSMSLMMPLMSMYFCIIMPAGLGIYWVASAVFQCVQQVCINAYMKNADIDKIIEKSRAKAAKKKAKGKKSLMERLTSTGQAADAAKEEYKSGRTSSSNSMKDIATINTKKIQSVVDANRDSNGKVCNVNYDAMGPIGKNAYLVTRLEEEGKTRGGKN